MYGYSPLDKDGNAMYGYSPLEDAFQRDYTINAVYLDVFRGSLYDPFGALPHILTGLRKPMSFFPCAARAKSPHEILERDFGGCVRVFKMLRKIIPETSAGAPERHAYTIEPGKFEYFVPVFKRLREEAESCVQAAKRVELERGVGDTCAADLKRIDRVFTKIAQKLFKKDDLGQDNTFKDKTLDIWKCTDELKTSGQADEAQSTCATDCESFWDTIRDVACRINSSRKPNGIFNFTSDDPKNADEGREHVWRVVAAIANTPK